MVAHRRDEGLIIHDANVNRPIEAAAILAILEKSRLRGAMKSAFLGAAIALGAAIPVSVALDNILLGMLVLLWPFVVDRDQWLMTIKRCPFAWAVIVFALVHVVGASYSNAPLRDVTASLYPALRVAFFLVLVTAFMNSRARTYASGALLASMILTLFLSYALIFGVIPAAPFKANELEPLIFKQHITHNFFMAYGVFACLVLAGYASSARARIGWACLAGAMVINVIVMIRGKTGHLVLLALLLYWFLDRLRWRGAIIGTCLVSALVTAAWMHGDNAIYARAVETVEQLRSWKPGEAFAGSVTQRLEFYHNTLQIIREHPLVGAGTGAFRMSYAQQVQGTAMTATHNPHNEYLKVTAELGVAGLSALIAMFWAGWRCTRRLEQARDAILARGLMLAYALASMVTSTLMDHAEGLFFVFLSAVLLSGGPWSNRSVADSNVSHDRAS